jgi:DNA-binding transcriptional ArsR family regulator
MPLSIYLCYILAEMKDPDYAVELESLLMALADKTRLRLLYLMADGEISVGDLTAAIGVSQPKISRHLAYLRSSGLVNTRRDGKSIYYSIRWPQDDGMFRVIKRTVEAMEASLQTRASTDASKDIPQNTPVISAQPDVSWNRREAHNELEEFLL